MICERCKIIEIDNDSVLCLCDDCFREFVEELDSKYLKNMEDKDNEKKN